MVGRGLVGRRLVSRGWVGGGWVKGSVADLVGSGSGQIRTFLVGSGSGRLGPDLDPGLNK
jgi:hypothetical protein